MPVESKHDNRSNDYEQVLIPLQISKNHLLVNYSGSNPNTDKNQRKYQGEVACRSVTFITLYFVKSL